MLDVNPVVASQTYDNDYHYDYDYDHAFITYTVRLLPLLAEESLNSTSYFRLIPNNLSCPIHLLGVLLIQRLGTRGGQ